MRFFTSMSSNPGFRGRGRGISPSPRWQRSYSDRASAPTQQPTSLTNGDPNASSGSHNPHSRWDGPRGPRPYTGHNNPQSRGRGPAYSHRPPPQYFGPPAPGPDYSHQRPNQFHGQGPPYTGPEPQVYMQQYYNQQVQPQWYRAGTPPNGMYGHMNVQQPKEMYRQPARPNKLAFYRRRWKFAPSTVPPQCERFRLLSYNILADYLATEHSHLYLHIPLHMRSWQWRMNKLLFEFQLWSPDVLCLQEVDRFCDLQIELERQGYSGIWKMRTGNAVDGCAIFWRTNRFKLLHHEYIEFSQIGLKDNVAQICVLESLVQKTPENDSSSAETSSNRVVVCNIHVLFNPKRGDIKIGQVRTLTHQALAVSKSWGDAPVVLCGDFNSTPNSPLYKFVLEQKLDLSVLARSEISGQKAGNALASTPNNHNFSRPTSSIGTMNGNRESTDQRADTGMSAFPTSSSSLHKKDPEEAESSENKGLTLSIESDATGISNLVGNDHIAEPIQKANAPLIKDSAAADGLQELDNGSSGVISPNYDSPLVRLDLGEVSQSEPLVENDDNVKGDSVDIDSTSMIVRQLEGTRIQNEHKEICRDLDANQELQESNYATSSTNFAGNSSDAEVPQKINSDAEELSQAKTLGVENQIFKESCVIGTADGDNPDPNFLSELLGTQDDFGFKRTQDCSAAEANNNAEFIRGSSNSCLPYNNDPYKWTPDELKAATGSEDCTSIEHGLKLRSVYTDVEENDGTKGPHGEPDATSYHRNFLGTVDYIWSSEDLKTVRVLDTIPKHILQETEGFPTKKWGSDHISLVCELAFTDG